MAETSAQGRSTFGKIRDVFTKAANKLAYGYARKLSLLCITLSAIGWIVFVAGTGSQVNEVDLSSQTVRVLFIPYWFSLAFGLAAFVVEICYIVLGSRFRRAGKVLATISTLVNVLYFSFLSAPLLFSALLIFGASAFGDFTDSLSDAIPVPDVVTILGLDNDVTDFLVGLVGMLFDLLAEGIELVVDLALSIPKDAQFNHAVRAQFSGSIISFFFLGISVFFWPFFSFKATGHGKADSDLR